ncbi:MAG: hypothetical protein SGI92_20665 [Bryobacteraceae bacterium]|nr:hypothetical protein [Bryobacteraceae bacterium]
MDDVLPIPGGTVPDADADRLKQAEVGEVFRPGATVEGIAQCIRDHVKRPELSIES